MNVFDDSPLEALPFNYSTFDFLTLLNNLWTWLALVTAAVGFWRVRAPKPESLPASDDRTSDPAPEVLELDAVREPACVPTVAVGDYGADVVGVTKGKFTLYYEDDIDRECEGDDVLTVTEKRDEREGRSYGCEAEWWESWEGFLRLRMGENENGWYTCQDLAELNGNVVRLWDGEFRFGTTFKTESTDSSFSSRVHVW